MDNNIILTYLFIYLYAGYASYVHDDALINEQLIRK